jgi:hypothetical protein
MFLKKIEFLAGILKKIRISYKKSPFFKTIFFPKRFQNLKGDADESQYLIKKIRDNADVVLLGAERKKDVRQKAITGEIVSPVVEGVSLIFQNLNILIF